MTAELEIHLPWLIDIHSQLMSNSITYDSATNEAVIEHNGELYIRAIDRRTLKRAFKQHNLQIPTPKPGRIKQKIPDDVIHQIDDVQKKIKIGVCKTHERIVADAAPEDVSFSKRTVYEVFKQKEILTYVIEPKPVKLFNTRYEAEKCDGIWHCDIHFFGSDNIPIIAFLDDKSRYSTSWSQLKNKSSEETKASLVKAFEKGRIPGVVWTDCGTEFRGEFERFLHQNLIQHQTTEPYSPQQNGKIERFWRELEKNCSHVGEIEEYIRQYHITPHMGLKKIPKRHLTPGEVYSGDEKWSRNEPVFWYVDGTRKILKE